MSAPFRLAGRLSAFDGIRGVAILWVVVHNVGMVQQVTAFSRILKAVLFLHAPGWVGVSLFFALSGFLITTILADTRGPGALRAFWIRRALRIFPLYYAVLFVSTVILPLVMRPLPHVLEGMQYRVWYWTYLSNWFEPYDKSIPAFNHFWSLAIEEQFYLVWPLFVLRASDRTVLRVSVGLAVLALAVRIGLVALNFPPGTAYTFTVARMGALTLGGAGAIVARTPGAIDAVGPRLRPILWAGGATLLAMAPVTHGFNRLDPWVRTVGYGVLDVLSAALVLEVARASGTWLGRLLALAPLRTIGKYSYAIYVFHFPIARVLMERFRPAINSPPLGRALPAFATLELAVLGLSFAAALVSWNLLEGPCLALKERFAPSLPRGKRAGGEPPIMVGSA